MPRKLTIEFCSIDAKDDGLCGYNPVAIVENNRGPAGLGRLNAKTSVLMEREYLTRLHSLQEEIRVKYLPLLDYNEPGPTERKYSHGLEVDEYKAIKQVAQEMFPGKEASYYT